MSEEEAKTTPAAEETGEKTSQEESTAEFAPVVRLVLETKQARTHQSRVMLCNNAIQHNATQMNDCDTSARFFRWCCCI